MRRLRVQSYKPSNSAKALADYLNIKRIQHRHSKFRGKPTDTIINWGNVNVVHNSHYLNPLQSVKDAANKITTFTKLKAAELPTPDFYFSKNELEEETIYLARTTVTGHSGEGIIVGKPSELPNAPLYTRFIEKKHEYRAIVVNNRVVDMKKKLKKRDFEGERSPYIWNCSNGYIFARNDIEFPETLPDLATKALTALNLTYGAIDIIEDEDQNLYILEINTAFGLEGTTTQLVGDAIKELL